MDNKEDLLLQLEYGSEIYIDNIPTYSIPIAELIRFPYSDVNVAVSLLTMDDDEANKIIQLKDEKKITTFIFLYIKFIQEYNLLSDNQSDVDKDKLYSDKVLKFLNLLFHEEITFDEDRGFIVGDNKYIINDANFNKIRDIIKLRMSMTSIDNIEDEDNPDSEFTKQLLAKRKMLHEKLKKTKRNGNDGDDIELSDLISIFAEAEHMTLQTVCENYDLFQFNNQFNRLKIMEDFKVNIRALMAGASDIELKHWITKIKSDSDYNDNEDED